MIEEIAGEFVTGVVYVALKKLLPMLISIVILGIFTHSLVAWLMIKRWSSKVAY